MNRISTFAFAALSAWACVAAEVAVDPDAALGPVKPVNGVGQPPMVSPLTDAPLFRYLKTAGMPYSRLHDVGGWLGGGLYVDIPNLFPDFEADENDPKNYRFPFTDALLVNLRKNGVEPFFRLGVTIENFTEYGEKGAFPAQNILPPKDPAKWARICEHVIRHYNEGWANGFRMNITYWEIWNEPENNPDDERNPMFRGPFDRYMELYGVAATHLKKCFPHLRIGGYGHCGFYAGVGSDRVAAANSSPRMEHFIECSHRFLKAARDNGWPLDFFSFHSYSEPREAMRQIRFADEHLDSYGFTKDRCERIFDEWLPYVSHESLGSAKQAAGVAAELIGLQNGPCAVACIYDARCGTGNYSPLFNPMTYKPHKAYYAFTAFNELRRRGTSVKTSVSGEADVWATAAKGADGSVAVMVANDSDRACDLAIKVPARSALACRLTDADRTDARLQGAPARLEAHAFCVVFFFPSAEVGRALMDAGWARVKTAYADPATKNIYAVAPKDCEPLANYEGGILRDRARYPKGVEDCPIVGGVALSMLVDRHAVTREASLGAEARWVAEGLRNLVFNHGHPGYPSRGLNPADGRSIGALSSRDQVTHLTHGLWRWAKSPLADADDRALASTTLVAVAEWMLRTVTAENDWSFGCADGSKDLRGVTKMRRVRPHEAARLAALYAATWDLTKRDRYRAALDETLDEALGDSEGLSRMGRNELRFGVPDYSLLQMASSLEVLRAVVGDSAARARLDALLNEVAALASRRDAAGAAHSPWLCGAAERPLVRLMAPAAAFSDGDRARLFAEIGRIPFERAHATRIVELSAAYWRLMARSARIESEEG